MKIGLILLFHVVLIITEFTLPSWTVTQKPSTAANDSSWSEWGPWSKECNSGYFRRHRTCSTPSCSGYSEETKLCSRKAIWVFAAVGTVAAIGIGVIVFVVIRFYPRVKPPITEPQKTDDEENKSKDQKQLSESKTVTFLAFDETSQGYVPNKIFHEDQKKTKKKGKGKDNQDKNAASPPRKPSGSAKPWSLSQFTGGDRSLNSASDHQPQPVSPLDDKNTKETSNPFLTKETVNGERPLKGSNETQEDNSSYCENRSEPQEEIHLHNEKSDLTLVASCIEDKVSEYGDEVSQ